MAQSGSGAVAKSRIGLTVILADVQRPAIFQRAKPTLSARGLLDHQLPAMGQAVLRSGVSDHRLGFVGSAFASGEGQQGQKKKAWNHLGPFQADPINAASNGYSVKFSYPVSVIST